MRNQTIFESAYTDLIGLRGFSNQFTSSIKEKGHKEGLEQGLEQGKEEKERAIILRAWKKGMPLEEIADLVDVPLTEVEGVISAYRTKNS